MADILPVNEDDGQDIEPENLRNASNNKTLPLPSEFRARKQAEDRRALFSVVPNEKTNNITLLNNAMAHNVRPGQKDGRKTQVGKPGAVVGRQVETVKDLKNNGPRTTKRSRGGKTRQGFSMNAPWQKSVEESQ